MAKASDYGFDPYSRPDHPLSSYNRSENNYHEPAITRPPALQNSASQSSTSGNVPITRPFNPQGSIA